MVVFELGASAWEEGTLPLEPHQGPQTEFLKKDYSTANGSSDLIILGMINKNFFL
jgi:hypothetical protein